MTILLERLESLINTYEMLRKRLDAWQVTGPLLTNIVNKTNPTYKYVVVYITDKVGDITDKGVNITDTVVNNKINTDWYEDFNDGKKHFSELNMTINENDGVSIIKSVVLIDTYNISVVNSNGDNVLIDECVKYINDAFNKVTVFPSHYFYPISWIGITDSELHKKMILDPECFMFQYGISTNNLAY